MSAAHGRRVVITGCGWVTPLGADVESVWTKLLAGTSAVAPLRRSPVETYATNFGAEVKEFDLSFFVAAPDEHTGAHPHTQFALAAAAQAWKQAKLGDISRPGQRDAGFPALDRARLGVYLGSGEGAPDLEPFAAANIAGWDNDRRGVNTTRWAEVARAEMTRWGELEQEPHAALTHVAEAFGAEGPASNCMTACAASTQSVGEAYEIVRRGDADVMLAGGSHSMLHPLGLTGFIRLTAMSTRRESPETASRPFDRTRDGFVMGEGAGIVVLEDLDHALARGATPLCEVGGYGSSADAYRITDIDPDGVGAARAMREAIEEAGIDPTQPDPDGRAPVQYLSAHGTSTPENDGIETKAVKLTFADQAPRVPFSSVKSMIGHLIQAAGAVELITCVQAVRTGWVPPTINHTEPGEGCDLDYVPGRARDLSGDGGVRVAMSNGFGFGGQNDTILVKRFER
ncbi:MAG: beta-ketoacyl-[acyl-carrier-protein] synthase family protein [Planctomycetota bacterium]